MCEHTPCGVYTSVLEHCGCDTFELHSFLNVTITDEARCGSFHESDPSGSPGSTREWLGGDGSASKHAGGTCKFMRLGGLQEDSVLNNGVYCPWASRGETDIGSTTAGVTFGFGTDVVFHSNAHGFSSITVWY